MLRKWSIAGFALALQLVSTAVQAEPYALMARYRPYDPNAKPIDIPLVDDSHTATAILPYDTASYLLEGVYVRLKTDDISKVSLSHTRNLVFMSGDEATNIRLADPPQSDVRLRGVADTPATRRYDIVVHSKPTADYLCGQETKLRDNWKTAKIEELNGLPGLSSTDLTSANAEAAMVAYGVLRKSVPADNESPILFTFCTPKADTLFNWDALTKPREPAKPAPATKTTPAAAKGAPTVDVAPSSFRPPSTPEGKALFEQHKRALSKKIVDFMQKTQKVTIKSGSEQAGFPENVYFESKHSFNVVNMLASAFHLQETDGLSTQAVGARTSIDQKSRLHVVADGDVCKSGTFSCAELMSRYIYVSLDAKDKDGNPIKKEVELNKQGYRATLKLALSEFVGHEVTLSVWYRNGDADFKLYEAPVSVENLGLTSSFPVVSEILALANRKTQGQANPADLKLQSSIPVSYAFGLTTSNASTKQMAITFPWMFGYNFRQAPRFADAFKVFAHTSVILPISDETTQKDVAANMAVGAGLSLANAFAFSWGITVTSDTPRHYLLVGLSVPDLIKAVDW